MTKLDCSGIASSITGSVGMPVSGTALTGAAPVVPSLVPPSVQASVPTISGLPANGIATINTNGNPW
ncbi:hypothetical protein DITRI_Ditri01bG0033900 [Diplodiscus trichospermus]